MYSVSPCSIFHNFSHFKLGFKIKDSWDFCQFYSLINKGGGGGITQLHYSQAPITQYSRPDRTLPQFQLQNTYIFIERVTHIHIPA